jgi:hypothetical protein
LSVFHHLLPPSWLIHRPPSSPVTTKRGFFGLIHRSWWSPCVPASLTASATVAKLLPPSSEAISLRFGL